MMIQVFGPNGMLGQAVLRAIADAGHEPAPCPVRLQAVQPEHIYGEVVINCAGLVKQRAARDSEFMLSNGYGPRRLAEACDDMGARLVHVSTDCVFDHPLPHDEQDVPSATDIYAVSKRAGEVTRLPHLTVRTSFVGFGPYGLVHDLQTARYVRASHNLLWTGHMVDTVARLLVALAERADVSGLLHIPGQTVSRFEMVMMLREALNLDTPVIRDDSFVADRRLVSNRWAGLGLPDLPSLNEQLRGWREHV